MHICAIPYRHTFLLLLKNNKVDYVKIRTTNSAYITTKTMSNLCKFVMANYS